MVPLSADESATSDDDGDGLALAALAFVFLTLIVLAATPTLLLSRVARTNREVSTVMLPLYEAVRHAGQATERRVSVARGSFITGASQHESQLAESRAEEFAALRVLRTRVPVLGRVAMQRVETLQRLAARRDSLEAALHRLPEPILAYPADLASFDALTDSMHVELDGLRRQVLRATNVRFEDELSWVATRRGAATLLGVAAAIASFAVAWFGRRQRRLKQELQAALSAAEGRRRELERVTESRERLVRGFTHDVKNPLGAASGYLQLLATGIQGRLTAAQTRSVSRANGSIGAALNIVEDLLELARAESGTLEITPVVTDMRALVLDVADEYRAQAETTGLRFVVQVPDFVPPLLTDRRRVGQVLGNLISNAIKYTHNGTVTLRLDLPEPGRVAISVRDTGPGIAAKQQHLLFDEFVRLDPEAADGTGVGLTISQLIAESLHGEIAVWSREGEGTTFTLWLPAGARPGTRSDTHRRPGA
jgi:signal transduction histidine kinase